jgi:hypothetical protein
MNLLGICFSIFDPRGIPEPRGLWWYKDVLGIEAGDPFIEAREAASATRRSATHLDGRQLDARWQREGPDGKRDRSSVAGFPGGV